MAYFSKDAYQGKAEWAARHNAEQSEIGIENGLTEDQAEVLEDICRIRHWIHTHQDALWYSESADSRKISNYLGGELFSMAYNVGLDSSNLYWNCDNVDDDSTYTWGYEDEIDEIEDEDEQEKFKEELYDKAHGETLDFMEKIDEDIQRFLKDIDNRYGTQYCPTGYARQA